MKKMMSSVMLGMMCLTVHADVTMEMARQYFSPESLNSMNIYVAINHSKWYQQPVLLSDFIAELRKSRNWPVRLEVETYVARSVMNFKITPTIDQRILRDRTSMYHDFADATCKGGINSATINILALYLPKVPRGKDSGHKISGICCEGGSPHFYQVDRFRRAIVHMIATGLADLYDKESEEDHIEHIGKVLASAQINEEEKFQFDYYYKTRLDALKRSKSNIIRIVK